MKKSTTTNIVQVDNYNYQKKFLSTYKQSTMTPITGSKTYQHSGQYVDTSSKAFIPFKADMDLNINGIKL